MFKFQTKLPLSGTLMEPSSIRHPTWLAALNTVLDMRGFFALTITEVGR